MKTNDKDSTAAVTSTAEPGSSYLEWGAVFGGVAVAAAISVVLLQFAAGIGMSVGAPTLEDGTASWNVIVASLWLAVVALASSGAGGYIAGRMRSRWGDAVEAEVEFRDGTHGLVVWALATLSVGMIMAVFAALSALSEARTAAPDLESTADMLRISANVSTIFSFATAAGAGLGAAVAWFAAQLGGEHRDKGLSINEAVPRVFRRKRTA